MFKAVPINRTEANDFISKHHRHNRSVQGYKFAIGVVEDDKLVGIAVVGRPVARLLDNGRTAEITRVCTDGTKNANSFLYSRVRRIYQLMGYDKVVTYTLLSESGSSLRAIGAELEAVTEPSDWRRNGRERTDQPVFHEKKIRWKL